MKGLATEIILVVGVLVAVGIATLQLRGIFLAQQQLGEEEVISAFAKDLESIIDKAIATTGDVAFIYYPSIKKYRVEIENNIVKALDKVSGKQAIFSKLVPQIVNNYLEDCEKIFVVKVKEKIAVYCECLNLGEDCSDSLLCCSGYCNQTSKKCEELPVCPKDRVCRGAPEAIKDSLGIECCPSDLPVCSNSHCCPSNRPKWCENPLQGEHCMSEDDYRDPTKCKKPSYKILFIQLNRKITNFNQKTEKAKDFWVSITPLTNCPESVEAIVVEDKVCIVPNQEDLCYCSSYLEQCLNEGKNCGLAFEYCTKAQEIVFSTLSEIENCARNWGYKDFTRIVGVMQGNWICIRGNVGMEGYTTPYDFRVIASEASLLSTLSHVLGHTYGLCDEGYGGGYCLDCESGYCGNSVTVCEPGDYCCPNKPEFNSIMCSLDTCMNGCSGGNRFAPTSYAHLEKELNKYCR